ncbi:MAG: hypothetical protein HDR24_05930 [Lachnospiraceae bacterium]|nr:hypothetical protein [Lachnospiraceae bacterium]
MKILDKKSDSLSMWKQFQNRYPLIAQFLVFFALSNGVTILQIVLMPFLNAVFARTSLVTIAVRLFPIGYNLDGSQYYIFNYASGPVLEDGTGGGLAYFLAVQFSLGIAQVLNFFLQKNITFRYKGSVFKAAFWYFFAYVLITFAAAALQGMYKIPLYHFCMEHLGNRGQTIADMLSMMINCVISFWIFFPIFKIIFKTK